MCKESECFPLSIWNKKPITIVWQYPGLSRSTNKSSSFHIESMCIVCPPKEGGGNIYYVDFWYRWEFGNRRMWFSKDNRGYQHSTRLSRNLLLLGFVCGELLPVRHGAPNPIVVWTNERTCCLSSVIAKLKLHVFPLVQTQTKCQWGRLGDILVFTGNLVDNFGCPYSDFEPGLVLDRPLLAHHARLHSTSPPRHIWKVQT